MLDQIRIVLCQTSHPGNIGASARAMKNMGLHHLVLVAPEQFPHATATERASGADDILAQAQVVATLEEAIADCQWIYGTSARQRSFPWPQLTPAQAAREMIQQSSQSKIAIVFGPERAGLLNEQLQLCDYHIAIPTHSEYASLNLAAAVQVISYEIFQQGSAADKVLPLVVPLMSEKASQAEVLAVLEHFEQAALSLGFLDPANPKRLRLRMQRLFAKAQLEKEEVNILRGFFKFVLQKVAK